MHFPEDKQFCQFGRNPDSKIHAANMGPTWVLSAPDGPHIGPMNLFIRERISKMQQNMRK